MCTVEFTAGHLRAVLEVRLDRLVGQLGDEVGLPVVLQAGRHQRVEGAVERRVRHRADVLGHHRRDVAERLRGRARPPPAGPAQHATIARNGSPCRSSGMNGSGGAIWKAGNAAELLGGVGDEVAEEPQHGPGVVQLEEHRPAVDVLDRVEPELERGHHAEVAAAAAQRPEQVRRSRPRWPRANRPSAVTTSAETRLSQRQPEPAGEVADAAAEGEPADAGGGDDPAGGGQAEGVGRGVEVAPGGAALGPGRPALRVDADAAHARTGRPPRRRRRCRSRARCGRRRGRPGRARSRGRSRPRRRRRRRSAHRTTTAGRRSIMAL